MTARAKGVAVLAVQLVLVLSIAVKYAWERHSCPRVWTRTGQVDPSMPLRGRYLALHSTADACSLSHGDPTMDTIPSAKGEWKEVNAERWEVELHAQNGRLVATRAGSTPDRQSLMLREGMPCGYALLTSDVDFFIPENAKLPFPLSSGQELWTEVTVPPQGPPRPIQLAISDSTGFHLLDLK